MKDKEIYHEYIIRYLDGSASEKETGLLLEWLKNDEQHMHLFIEIRDIWESTGLLGNQDIDTEIALNRFKTRVKKLIAAKKENKTRHLQSVTPVFYRVAVMLIIAVVGGFALFTFPNRHNAIVAYNKTIIPRGQKGQLVLADGTKIWLNSESCIQYPTEFGRKTRDVYLKGEAYFDVTHNASKPFFVHLDKITIKVLGTSFNLKSYPDDDKVETILVKGSIKIYRTERNNNTEIAILKPNEKAIFNRRENRLKIVDLSETSNKTNTTNSNIQLQASKSGIVKIFKPTVESDIQWKDQKLIFNNESLDEMVKRLERWYNKNIHIESEILRKSRYSGKFIYNETIYQVLDVICRSTNNMSYYEKNHEIYITSK